MPVALSARRFPHWKTVYHVFRQWIANHYCVVIHDTLRVLVRRANGKRSRPTAAILDSQSVKSAGHGGQVGYDATKRVKGLRPKLEVEVVKRADDLKGFKVLPHRWEVERTFGWLMRQRRLVRDYETTEANAEAWIYIAKIRMTLRRQA